MTPDETNDSNDENNPASSSQQAAAQLVRSQIDRIYDGTENSDSANTDQIADQWKKYHTAWQTYYQKYYEGYYKHHLINSQTNQAYFTNTPPVEETEQKSEEILSPKEAIIDLREKLLDKVTESATKVKKSRHFKPIAAGLSVVLLFLFLQYGRILASNVMAYISPGDINPQNIIVNPSGDITVGPEPKLIIPKINVDVPVIYDIGNDYESLMAAMDKGVAHFAIPGASSHPGQIGNTVISGHSSSDWYGSGDYKFIFVQLDKLSVGDTIYANYQSKRYTYKVTKKETVSPTDVNKLVYPTTIPIMTLITCMPLGTDISRLFVIAEQISPDPNQSEAAPTVTNAAKTSIPGNQPTFFEWLFGKKD